MWSAKADPQEHRPGKDPKPKRQGPVLSLAFFLQLLLSTYYTPVLFIEAGAIAPNKIKKNQNTFFLHGLELDLQQTSRKGVHMSADATC